MRNKRISDSDFKVQNNSIVCQILHFQCRQRAVQHRNHQNPHAIRTNVTSSSSVKREGKHEREWSIKCARMQISRDKILFYANSNKKNNNNLTPTAG